MRCATEGCARNVPNPALKTSTVEQIIPDGLMLQISFFPDLCKTLAKMKNLDPEDFYRTPEGYLVFTEAYHRKRGHCCQSGCRHCPYGFDKGTGRVLNPFGKPTAGS
jgi:hypothetical protein